MNNLDASPVEKGTRPAAVAGQRGGADKGSAPPGRAVRTNLEGQAVSRRTDQPSALPDAADREPSDGELVNEARNGRAAAFDQLIERYQRTATSVAYRLVGNLHDALEVCQDAFVRAYRNLESLEDVERFRSWFLRIVTNLSLNFRRDRRVGPKRVSFEDCIAADGDELRGDRLVSRGAAERPGAKLAAEELSGIVQKAMSELPEAQRTALVLFSIEQLPQREVASILGCSVEAVKWHVFQARRKLRERLAEYLQE